MSTQILRFLIAGALFVHGTGHALGFWMPARSWLFPNLGEPILRIISSIFWILAAIGFLAAFLGFLDVLVPSDLWRPLAVGSAFVSIFGLVLFWGTWPAFNTIGAFGMNIVVLIILLWPSLPPTTIFEK
jgi:hypothetical protein